MTSPSERVRLLGPAERQQCEFPSERMLNQGGCTYGSTEERAQWRVEHMARRRAQGWPSGRADPSYCARTAKWSVDGEHLCALHSGAKALDILHTGREAPPAEEKTDMTSSIAVAIGLSSMLTDGGPLSQLRGHANRLAGEIEVTARETGGDPSRSRRWGDAQGVIEAVGQLQKIADGDFFLSVPRPTTSQGVLDEVAAERVRQIAKGYTSGHDDLHSGGTIAQQAAHAISLHGLVGAAGPWIAEANPDNYADRRRQLIQGIALAVAEVERLDRAAQRDFVVRAGSDL